MNEPTTPGQRPQSVPLEGRREDAMREGASRSGTEAVGVNRRMEVDDAEHAEPGPPRPLKQHNERDESPVDMTDPHEVARQPMRRAGDGAPPVIRQAHDDVERGLQDTDLYAGSGNLGGADDRGRRADPAVDRSAEDNDVRRSGHDVGH